MSVYVRPDSPYYWMWLEDTAIRESTGIPRRGGSPKHERELKRAAEAIYANRKTQEAKRLSGLIVTKPSISYVDFAAWYARHETAHHRGADKERSILKQLAVYFSRFTRLAEMDADAVKEWMTYRKHQVAPGTVNRELDVLKRLLAAAVPRYLDASPITGLRRFRVVETEPRILTVEEEDRLLGVCGPADLAFILTAIDTLWRLSSVVNLKWPQVKFDQLFIVPLNAKVKHEGNPITDRMVPALKALSRDHEWVFPQFHKDQDTKTAAKNRAIRRFLHLCQLALIPHSRAANGVTFHSLRHTGATRALQHGASVRTVMKLGGWQDERSVMRYVHAADSDVRQAAESISQRPPRSRTPKTATK
jgi:integrase